MLHQAASRGPRAFALLIPTALLSTIWLIGLSRDRWLGLSPPKTDDDHCSLTDIKCIEAFAKYKVERLSQQVQQQVHVGECALDDAECIKALAIRKASEVRVGDCSVTDSECLAAQAQRVAEAAHAVAMKAEQEVQAQVLAAAAAAKHDLEKNIGCSLTDEACLRAKGEAAQAELAAGVTSASEMAGAQAVAAIKAAAQTFEDAVGCQVTDEACLAAKAREASAQASASATEATQEAAERLATALGCPSLADEACLLRRGQELSVALSLIASTVALTAASGG